MNTLKAEKRSLEIKAKKLRREGYVVGNVFGREIEGSIPVKMAKGDVEKLLKTSGKGSQILLEIEGRTYDVLVKDVAFDPTAGRINEIDFQALVSNEMVHSVAEVVPVNHEKIAEGVLQIGLSEIAYRALPAALIDKVKIDVGRMKIGDAIRVKDLPIASDPNLHITTDPEAVVVSVAAVHNAAIPEETKEETAE